MRTRILPRWKTVFLGGLLGIFSLSAQAEGTDYTPTPENLQARKEFQDGKFGIFLHWGIYSMFGQGEWYMNTANIDCHEYAKAASGFYPSRFNAQEWVAAIKASGAKYICITSRHHDGFSMFDTKYSDYDIVDATPFKRDVIKELAEECRKQGIRLHLYYSHLDWTREDYYPLGNTGHGTGRTSHGEWATYYQFMNHQMNGMWGYKIKDQNYKSVTDLVRLLVRAAGKGTNLLMNIGPQPNGELPAVAVERLKGVGDWMSKYGETIYGTTAGNVMSASWGTTTRKDNMLYVHLLADHMPQFVTLPVTEKVISSTLFGTDEKVKWEKIQGGIVLHTENLQPSVDCIVALKLK